MKQYGRYTVSELKELRHKYENGDVYGFAEAAYLALPGLIKDATFGGLLKTQAGEAVRRGLKNTIQQKGPVTKQNMGSAVKRILGQMYPGCSSVEEHSAWDREAGRSTRPTPTKE